MAPITRATAKDSCRGTGALAKCQGLFPEPALRTGRFARNRRQGVRGYTNFVSLLVGAVHFFLQFLQELGALLGG